MESAKSAIAQARGTRAVLIVLLVVVSASQCSTGQDLSGATFEELIELLDSNVFDTRVASTDELPVVRYAPAVSTGRRNT